jgi:hypothetical protein
VKNVRTSAIVNRGPDDRPSVATETKQTAWSRKAMTMVFSLPVRSENQPQKMRLAPLASGPNTTMVLTTADNPHALAMSRWFAVRYKPPVATMTNMA